MEKVLLLQGTIPHYRVPIFNELAKRVDLTVVYSYGKEPEGIEFKVKCIPTIKIRYKFYKESIIKFAKKFDVVISMSDFSYMAVRLFGKLSHNYKLIYWGIGVSASYDCRYDSNEKTFKNLKKRYKKADALVFYSSYPIQKYVNAGIKAEKIFVANNTVKVLPCDLAKEKNQILFIGSLYKQKKVDLLLENYLEAYKTNEEIPELLIVGDGEEKERIISWITENKLNDKIHLTGAVYQEEKLKEYFERAIVCISPDQAGLAVLQSMGYGVPFVTHKNAITGGEIFNILNGENGILLEEFSQLKEVILDCANDKEKYLRMGKLAYEHYHKERTVERMVDGFVNAVAYVKGNKHGEK